MPVPRVLSLRFTEAPFQLLWRISFAGSTKGRPTSSGATVTENCPSICRRACASMCLLCALRTAGPKVERDNGYAADTQGLYNFLEEAWELTSTTCCRRREHVTQLEDQAHRHTFRLSSPSAFPTCGEDDGYKIAITMLA